MGIDSLKTILSPPVDPQEVALTDDWEAIEKQLSTPLPKDYKAFVRAYGTGTINHFIVVYNPFSRNKFVRLVERGQRLLQSLATLISDFPEYYPHVVYPAPGGLLPFAGTDNGDVFYWQTIGTPEKWTVRVLESRGPDYYDFAGQMTDFLESLLTKSIQCDVLPQSFPFDRPVFEPIGQSGGS